MNAPPFSIRNGGAKSDLLIICDHASNFIPEHYGRLGLPPESLERHIAYDIGAGEVAAALAERLNCVGLLAGFSRLLIDANRGLDDPTLVMKLSDGEVIPGNRHVDPHDDKKQWQERIDKYYAPYRNEIDRRIDALEGERPFALFSLHSFTPIWKGWRRPWDAGLLHGIDDRFAVALIEGLRAEGNLEVGCNEPYPGGIAGESIETHGYERGLLNVTLEIRQDHLQSAEGRAEWVERLVHVVPEALARARASKPGWM
ncbi:MAG: N-formylglutamate amidohydrolase [Hyphomicrobiales bacterium]|nr:N-formylglutamate amidohydrolase [Hyphomicrobiales bacterium]